MLALSVQTLLLMGAAYFIGAALACLLRRSLFTPAYRHVERRVDPLPQVRESAAAAAPSPARESPPARPQPTVQPPVAPAVSPPPAAAVGPQDLKRIRLIDAGLETGLNKLGVNRYEQIAAWNRADVKRVSEALGIKGRINQENWIEQALVLSKGGETDYAMRRARGEGATAAPTPDQGDRGPPQVLPLPMSRAGVSAVVVVAPAPNAIVAHTPPLVSERAAFAENGRRVQVPAAVPMRPATSGSDNLQRIGSITAAIDEKLRAEGVTRYVQIAQWSPADIGRFEQLLATAGRIARENWVEQAQILSRGGDTRFSREFDGADTAKPQPPMATARTDLGSLRSVRSAAYQESPEPGPEAARRAAAQNKILRGPISNDLKRIRGIGVLIEKRLHAMGVSAYEHIANWTADDIDRVSQTLDFKGRIERENWVEQARILSAGGHTEFSRRVDRGEVETSRPKT